MKTVSRVVLTLLVCAISVLASCKNDRPANVLLITGGHDYDKESFDAMLGKLGITYDHVEHPAAHEMLGADSIGKYDVVVLYDMPGHISPEAQRDFIGMLEKGKGLVVLHHAFCSYDFWPEYTRIAGGRYHHYPWMKDGEEQPVSAYKHDISMRIGVADKEHPVTKGVSDFDIIDEAYGRTEILPEVHPLLSTDEPSSAPLVCWTNTYGNSRVVTLTLGHDRQAWENQSFVRILSQAIEWVRQTPDFPE